MADRGRGPPLALLMVLAGDSSDESLPVLDISNFTEKEPGAKFNFVATMNVGFGHTPYPGDYRSKAQIGQGK